MSPQQVSLRFWRGAPSVSVRELTGHDERRVRDASTRAAVELLTHLVEQPAGGPWRADELTAPDRDRLLTAVYRSTFGKRIDSTVECRTCASPFDLAFLLDDLVAAVERARTEEAVQALADGTFRTTAGLRFRLPSARDEMEVAALASSEAELALAQRCVVEAPEGLDAPAAVEQAMEDLAPVLDLDIDTACPECGARQAVHFDVQFYLLRAIAQEQNQMLREVHRIASAYGWELDRILDLPRSERRAFVDLIESEMTVRRRAQ